MKHYHLRHLVGIIFAAFCGLVSHAQATTQPKFTIIPVTSTHRTILFGGNQPAQYTVTNQTKIPRTLTYVPASAGITQNTFGVHACQNPFTLSAGQSCELNLEINSRLLPVGTTEYPVKVCKTLGDGNPTATPFLCSQTSLNNNLLITIRNTAPISATPTRLTMPFSSQQTITVTNTSPTLTANNITARLTGTALEGKVTVDDSACSSVAPGQSCVLTFTSLTTSVSRTFFPILGTNTSIAAASISVADNSEAILSVAGSPLILSPEGASGILTVTNTSETVIATGIEASLSASLTAAGVIVESTSVGCASLAPGESDCVITVAPGATPVTGNATISGTNTSEEIATVIVDSESGEIAITSSSTLAFPFSSGSTPQTMTITNTGASSVTNITADFTNTNLNGAVTVDDTNCIGPIAPGNSCALSFALTSATNVIQPTTFPISGDGTNSVVGTIAVGNNFLYLSQTASITRCSVDPYTSNLASCGTVLSANSPYGVAVDSVNNYLYFAQPNNISRCSIDIYGALSSCISSGTYSVSLFQLALSPDYVNLYSPAGTQVYLCKTNTFSSCNSSTPAGTITAGYTGITVGPTNAYAYLVAELGGSNTALICEINLDGTFQACTNSAAFDTLQPVSIAVSPSNTYAYITSFLNNSLYQGTITDAGETIDTWNTATTIPAGQISSGLAMNAAGTVLYMSPVSVTGGSIAYIQKCVINQGDGTLTCSNSGAPGSILATIGMGLWEPPQ